nr:hypothetical protein [Escherichia coli]
MSTANTWSARQTFSAGITGTLTGNADTATKLKTARKINGVAFDGSADITLTPEDLGLTDIASQAGNAVQRSGDTMGGELKIGTLNALRIFNQSFGLIFRRSEESLHLIPTNEGEGENGDIGPLRPFAINLRTGLVSIGNGVTVSGGITGNLTGNADTATKLKTARTIGGVSFDGSANIDLPGVNKTGNQSTTGNAATATKLQTARTIGGVSFDGSANINLPGVNIAGNQNTTGNAATATKLQTARTINGVNFDGSANISIPTITSRGRVTALTGTTQGATTGLQMYEAYNNGYPSAYGNVLHLKGATAVGEGELFIGWSGTSGAHAPVHVRSRRDTDTASWSEWAQVYTSKDSIPGVNTTGNQNTTGNAASATKLQTARTIGGVSFNGTANIDLPGVNKTGNQSTTGNAATATKLQTARTINGVSFDGTANISLSPANIGCPASPTGWLETGDNGASITTEQLVTLLRDNGAFNAKVWIARCAWAYANSASIPDSETGCGIIPLAGAVIEVFNNGSSSNNYTIRITTATTTSVSGALTNAEFVYVFNGTSYSPGWRRAYNTKNKPTAADVGALPLSGGSLTGGLTAAGEIISKSANGLRIAYGNYGFFIRNDGSSTYFMLTNSGDSLGTWNSLRPLTINNANGAVSIGNGLTVNGDIGTNAWVYANRFAINSSTGAWINMRDQNVIFGRNAVSTDGAQALLRQDHADRKFFIGGLGNSQFGFYMINNSRTANGTDGQAFLNSSGNFQCGGQIVPANYSNFDSRYALKTAYISSVRLGSAASYKPSSNGVSWTQNLGSGLVMTGIIVQETGSNSADNIGGIYYRPVQYCINGTWYTAASV